MTAYLRELRKGLDRIGQQRHKRLALNATFTCGTWYDGRQPEAQGFDPAKWIKEKLVDCIMPEGRDVQRFIEMCKGTATGCYPRYCMAMSFEGGALMTNLHDPTPQEDKTDRPPENQYGPLQIAAGALKWYDAGADGIFLFNFPDAWTTLRNLPYPDLLRRELANGRPFGMHEGEEVVWCRRRLKSAGFRRFRP
jgi:hypothetical protein